MVFCFGNFSSIYLYELSQCLKVYKRVTLLIGWHLWLLLHLGLLARVTHGALLTTHRSCTFAQPKHVLDLLGCVVLGPSEDEAFGDALASQLVNLFRRGNNCDN